MKWTKQLPRESGWYWVKIPAPIDEDAQNYDVVVMQVEGRDESDDGWVWLDNANRYYLTVGVRDESGDDKQSESWMEWEWAGPLTPPNAPSAAAARDG